MHHHTIHAMGILLAAASMAAVADPGVQWRVTTSMSGLGMNMPSRISDICVTGNKQDQPPPSGQGDCQYTEMSRTGSTVHYVVRCKNMKGAGDISYAADHYSGKFDMQSDRGKLSATYEGQKLGTCENTQAQSGTGSDATAKGAANRSAAPGASSTVGSELQSAAVAGASQVKDAATDVASDAAQSAKDDATQSVKDKVENKLKGLFGP